MYMLDTNICIYIINQKPQQVFERFKTLEYGKLCISSITAAELAFGVEKSGSLRNKQALEKFLSPLEILPFSQDCIWQYGKIRNELQKQGQIIGAMDLLIAAHACAMGCVLVTNNLKEFERVQGLALENWVDSAQ